MEASMASAERLIKGVEATEAVEGARALSMEDIYKQTERRYKLTKVPINRRKNKYRPTAPDLSGVLDLSDQEGTEEKGLVRPFLVNIPELKAEAIRAYALTGDYDGFYVLRGAMPIETQLYWAWRCVSEFSGLPHTNLTNLHGPGYGGDLWRKAVESDSLESFQKLRWANLGRNYVWGRRAYDDSEESSDVIPLPVELAEATRAVADALGFDGFSPESGICNYYPMDGAMGGHVDDAESAMEQPIVSLSMGSSAVFLLGGRTRDQAPLPILIRSGDVVVMGRQSRLCYHGIASILPDTAPGALLEHSSYPEEAAVPEADRPLLARFLSTSRINLNVRQVRVHKERAEGGE